MFKKILFLALTAVILQARMVTDSEGKEVRIPDVVERATPMIGAFVQMSAMLGQQEKIISGASRLPPLMAKIFPKIRTSGNQSGMLGSSVETLIASKTQVVFGPVSMMFDENQIKQLNAAGIAVVRLDKFGTIGEIKSCVSKIAEILGGKSVQKFTLPARNFRLFGASSNFLVIASATTFASNAVLKCKSANCVASSSIFS